MILFNMTMSVCSFVEWSCCCLLDVFCIIECEFVGFCADQNRTEWVWSATCETVRRVFVALEHRCLWSAVVCSAPAVLDVSSVLRSCFIVQSENKKKRFILSKITIRNTIVWRVQRLHNKTNKPATPSGRACWCDFGWTETWNLQLIQSCCKVKICGFNSQLVMNEGCFTCSASVGGSLWKTSLRVTWTEQCGATVWTWQSGVSNVSSSRANYKLTC